MHLFICSFIRQVHWEPGDLAMSKQITTTLKELRLGLEGVLKSERLTQPSP